MFDVAVTAAGGTSGPADVSTTNSRGSETVHDHPPDALFPFLTTPRMRSRIRSLTLCIAAASFAALLSGCGGGGSAGIRPSAPDPAPPPPSIPKPDSAPDPVPVTPQTAPPPPLRPALPPPTQQQTSCVDTADYGCISEADFGRLRNDIAAVRLADGEFSGSPTNRSLLGQWALEELNVHEAHAAITVKYGANTKPGAGVTVAVLDSGVDLDHREFDGASITETFLQGLPDERRTDYDASGFSHGTAITSIMAAQPNGAGFLGIAWGATFKVFTVPIGEHIPDDDDRRQNFDWESAYKDVLGSGVDIVNASYSLSGTFIEHYTADDLRNSAVLGPGFEVIAQRGVADPAIFVWAAGNDHGDPCEPGDDNCFADSRSGTGYSYRATSPNLEGGAVAKLLELQGHNVVVVAVDRNGRIDDFSNRCGIAGRWCIAAPGVGIRGAEFGSTAPSPGSFRVVTNLEGTSVAAPLVSGGLALMKHFFRNQLSNEELVTRLFATADKSGIYRADRADATSSVYGQGLMDLGAAVSPVDEPTVPTNHRVSGDGPGIQTTRLNLGQAFGDSLGRSLAGREIATFDGLGAPFWFNFPDLVGEPSRPSLSARLHRLIAPATETEHTAPRGTQMTLTPYERAVELGGWRVGLYESPAHAESSLLNLAENAATVTFTARNGLEATALTTAHHPAATTREIGALLAWRSPDSPVGLRAGWLAEEDSVLRSRAQGAFGRLAADNLFAGFEATTEVGDWRLAFDTEIGLVTPDADGGLIDRLSPLTTSAMSFRADRRLTTRDELTVSLAQPLRIESGSATFRVPVGRTRKGEILAESFSADLVPSARQVDLSARWRRTGVLGGALQVEAAASHNPGHAATKPELSLLAGWRLDF